MTTDISVVRWDPSQGPDYIDEYEYDGGNSSSRLFERSRIKALAGESDFLIIIYLYEKIAWFFRVIFCIDRYFGWL